MSGELALGLASGFRQRRDQQKAEDIVATERARQNQRQDVSDARLAEASNYAKTQRPMQERATAATVANAEQTTAFNKQKFDEATRAAHDEGFYDFVDQLDRGVDPQLALRQYNARGSHKIDPKSFSFDPRTKNMQFTDEDGPQTANAAQLKGVLADSLTPSTTPKTTTMKSDEAIVDTRTGQPIIEGPQYQTGKDKPLIKGKPGEVVYDPNTQKFKTIPGTAVPGKAPKKVSVTGAALSPWNEQTAQKATREVLASSVGLKYDPETEQITGGKPGATQRWFELSSAADAVTRHMQDSMGPAEVSHLVSDAYAGVKTEEEYLAEAEKHTTRMRHGSTDQPDSWLTREEPADLWKARIKDAADKMKAADMKTAEEKLAANLPAVGVDPPDAGTVTDPTDDNDSNGDGLDDDTGEMVAETPTADDLAPAGAAPASTAAQPSPRAHYGVTLDRVTSPDQVAMDVLRKNPAVMQLLQAPVDQGHTAIVKFPNGKAYFLAGTELREFKNFKAPGGK